MKKIISVLLFISLSTCFASNFTFAENHKDSNTTFQKADETNNQDYSDTFSRKQNEHQKNCMCNADHEYYRVYRVKPIDKTWLFKSLFATLGCGALLLFEYIRETNKQYYVPNVDSQDVEDSIYLNCYCATPTLLLFCRRLVCMKS